jgi:hypothetical protein
MKPTKVVDGGRDRCLACGHPKREHRAGHCTVPKCACLIHSVAEPKK